MNTLYIVGNGFDLHHQLDTRYRSFGLYLQKHNRDIYDQLLEYFGLPHLQDGDLTIDPLWRDFEDSLSLLDSTSVFDAFTDSLACPGSPSFRDRDWYSFAIDMEMVVENLTDKMIEIFRRFILAVKYQPFRPQDRLLLDSDAAFLSFNYTDTLEKFYSIPESRITYIHGKAGSNDEIILGHGIDPDNFKEEEPVPPEGLNDEEFEQWQEYMNDQYDHSFELGKQALSRYFSSSFKNTSSVISSHADFFSSIAEVKKIYILGHSLSEVDLPYFQEIVKQAKSATDFVVSYHADYEQQSHRDTLLNLGVAPDYLHMIKLCELTERYSLEKLFP